MCATPNGRGGRKFTAAALVFGSWLLSGCRSSPAGAIEPADAVPPHEQPEGGEAGVSGAVKDVAKDVAEDAAENLLESGGTALQAGSLAAWGSGLWAVLSLLLVALGAKAVAAALRQRKKGAIGGRTRLLDLLPVVVLLAGGLVVAAQKGLVPALVAVAAAVAFGADAILKAIHARRARHGASHVMERAATPRCARPRRWPRSREVHPCAIAAGSDAPPSRQGRIGARRIRSRTAGRV